MKSTISVISALLLVIRVANGQDIASIRQRLDLEVTRSYAESRDFSKHVKVRMRAKLIDADSKETLRETEEQMIFADNFALHRFDVQKGS